MTTTYGTASSETAFSVSGTDMNESILVTPPLGYEVSLTSGGTFTPTVSVGAAGTISSTPVYVRLAATTTPGTYSGNIVLSSAGATNVNVATVSSTVNPKQLTVTGATASNKIYNGNTIATITGSTLVGIVGGDIVTINGTGTFASAGVGTAVSVTSTQTLGGANASNYTLVLPTGLTANITELNLTISGLTADNKLFDGNTTATLSGTPALVGVIAADLSNVMLTGTYTANFTSPIIGTAIPVIVTGYTLTGSASGNYTLTQPTGLSADITAVPSPVISSVLTANAVYGELSSIYTITASNTPTSFNATGLPAGLSVNTVNGEISGTPSAVPGIFNVTISATNAGGTGTATLVYTITPKALTVTNAIADNKIYDRTNAATISGSTLVGVIGGDVVTISNTGTFANMNVGTIIMVTSTQTLGGADATKYTVTLPTGLSANITPKPLTIAGAVAQNKVFDGNTTATITGTLSGVIPPDVVTLTLSGNFMTSAVGNGIPVNSTSVIAGADVANYTLTQPMELTANITGVLIANWTYEPLLGTNANPTPNTGTGTSALIGAMVGFGGSATGMNTLSGCGTQTSGTNAWAITTANPGTSNESSGAQFNTSTVGFENIVVTWEQRWSNTAANTIRLQYTTDGTTWNNFTMTAGNTSFCLGSLNDGRFEANTTGDQYRRITVDLSSISAANHKPNFGIRVVAAHYQTTGQFRQTGNPTMVAVGGTWRFDNVKFEGIPGTPPAIPTVNLSVNTNTASETAATVVTVTATASAAVSGDQTVSLAVTGTGITAGDYTLSNATITVPTGMTTGTVTFTVIDDVIVEGTETATLTINNPSSGIQLGTTTVQNIVITDNDNPPTPTVSLSVSSNAGSEGANSSITVTATTSAAVTGNQTVNLIISGTNITTSDYFLTGNIITILNGQTTGTVTFVVADDGIQENTETAILTIGTPSVGLVLGTPITQNITIENNSCGFMRKVGTVTSALGAEIPAFDPGSNRIYVVAGTAIEYFNLSNLGIPTYGGVLALGFTPPANTNAIPNSVAIKNGIVAVAYAIQDITTLAHQVGRVSFYTASTAAFLNSVAVGFLPDMVTFTPDGNKVLTADEGEPNSYGQGNSFDPVGSVSIIDISGGIQMATVQTASFTSFNSQLTTLRAAGVRIYGPGSSVEQDFEPEYIAFSSDGLTAMVTLQENNAFAVLDIASSTITSIVPLGLKDHNILGYGMDASDRDLTSTTGKINIQNWPVSGMYQPDAIASYNVAGQTYYITANEGDSRAYTGYSEEIRVGAMGYVLDPTAFPNAATLKLNENLGRLQLTNATGDTDGDGDFDRIDALGARSFSIWNSSGALVYDSKDMIEQLTATKSPSAFNSEGASINFDTRSDSKGPEPEGVVIGNIGGIPYAFIGLERVGDIMVFNVANPTSPVFVQYINTAEDLAVEGLTFVEADKSPTGKPLLITTAEISKTTTVYEIGTSIVTNSSNAGVGSLRAAIDCALEGATVIYDQPTITTTILTSPLVINKNVTLLGLSSAAKPEITVDFTTLGTNSGVSIGNGKNVILKDIDFKDINNTNMPNNSIIEVQNSGALKVTGSTIINKQ
ncbi:MAG: choice-of-anchor I family protein [Saprospiraceae bacterium]|nr:choice-of-anchor I family protein [Saprospiraceae bacterium]